LLAISSYLTERTSSARRTAVVAKNCGAPRAHYVCQTDKLLAKYVKIAEVDSGHILELDKTMKNMRFMTNMNDQYTNKSDNKEDGKDDVDDINPGDKLVN
jgi:hypothetical protein